MGSPYGAFAGIPDAMKQYWNGLLPVRAINGGLKLSDDVEQGKGWLEKMLGMAPAEQGPDTSYHDQMVRQALHSHGARAEDEPVPELQPKAPRRQLPH